MPEISKEFSYVFDTYSHDYLQTLINKSTEDHITLRLNDSDLKLNNFCCRNKKNLHIIGDVGKYFAHEMKDCKVILDGNCEENVGKMMKNCQLIINGNLFNTLGLAIENSYIEVNGNVGDDIGPCMINSTIRINGKCGKISPVFNGEIHINGNITSIEDGIYNSIKNGFTPPTIYLNSHKLSKNKLIRNYQLRKFNK